MLITIVKVNFIFLLVKGVGCFVKECEIGWSAWFLWNPKLFAGYFLIVSFVSPTVLFPIKVDWFVVKE